MIRSAERGERPAHRYPTTLAATTAIATGGRGISMTIAAFQKRLIGVCGQRIATLQRDRAQQDLPHRLLPLLGVRLDQCAAIPRAEGG